MIATALVAAGLLSAVFARQSTVVFKHAGQVAALDVLVGGAALSDEDLIARSRLLGSPVDQIQWLMQRAQERRAQGDEEAVRPFLSKIQGRIERWRSTGVDGLQPFDDRIRDWLREARPLAELLDPAQLRAALDRADASALRALSDTQRFALVSRGVPVTRLGGNARRAMGPWDQARLTLAAAFADNSTFIRRLTEQQKMLADGTPQNVTQAVPTFEITHALINLSLGADGTDIGKPRWDQSSTWAGLAQQLEDDGLWRWGAAARLLEALTASGNARTTAVQRGEALLQRLRLVAPQPADVDTRLTNLFQQIRGDVSEAFPGLARSAARTRRSEAESAFLQAWSSADPARVITAMQTLKASERNGRASGPVGLAALQQRLRAETGYAVGVTLYLELADVGGQYHGLALHSTTGTRGVDDSYAVALVGPRSDLAALTREATGLVPGAIADGRFLVATDGRATRPAGLRAIESALLPMTREVQGAFLQFLPSAAVLAQGSDWRFSTVSPILYRAFVADGGQFSVSLSRRNPKSYRWGLPIGNDCQVVAVVAADAPPSAVRRMQVRTFLEKLIDSKKRGRLTEVFPYVVAK